MPKLVDYFFVHNILPVYTKTYVLTAFLLDFICFFRTCMKIIIYTYLFIPYYLEKDGTKVHICVNRMLHVLCNL